MKALAILALVLSASIAKCQSPPKSEPASATHITADAVAEMSAAGRSNYIAYYEKRATNWPSKDLLPVAIAYAMEQRFEPSKTAYSNYLSLNPDNARAQRGLGQVYAAQKHFDLAITHLSKAWELRDVESLPTLAGLYVAMKRFDKAKELVPDMLQARDSTPARVRRNLVEHFRAIPLA